MFARIDVPKAADLDAAIRAFRTRFDKVSEVYYPQKDAKGRRGYGDFMFSDPIKKWDFISEWCDIFEDSDGSRQCELSIASHAPKSLVKLAKHFPKLLAFDSEFGLSQSILHRQIQDCRLSLSIDKSFPGEYELELEIEEWLRKAKAVKGDAEAIGEALRELWQPVVNQFSNSASVTIIPQVSGTKFKATKSDTKLSVGKLTKPVNDRDEVIELVNEWAKWSCKLPKSIKVLVWSFQGKFPESESLKFYQLFRKLVDHGAWLSLTGKYRKGFKIDSLNGKFPAEGYWRFPLFRATAGLAGAHELVELVLTRNGNFFEYGPMSDSHVEKFKKHKNFKGGCTLALDPYGCTSGTQTLQELFDKA